MWNQLMIDIETMGGPPDGALIAIGGALFDLQRYEIGPTFVMPVHLATSVRLGMKIDPSTVMWWMRQSDAARMAVVNSTSDVLKVLQAFNDWLAEHTRRQDLRVWGNGSTFDLTIMGTAYSLAGMTVPWTYGKETCFRTVRNMNSHVPYDPSARTTVHHNALDDSLFQIEHLFRIRRYNLEHRALRPEA